MPLFGSRTNNLSWPAGRKPGINYNHVSLQNGQLRFSAVANYVPNSSGAFYSLFPKPIKGTIAGTVRSQFHPIIGPCAGPSASGGTNGFNFATVSTVQDALLTFGAILIVSPTLAEGRIVTSGTSTNYMCMTVRSTPFSFGMQQGQFGNTSTSGIIPTVNVPYFVGASMLGSGANQAVFVVRNLNTGQIRTASTTGFAPAGAPNGTASIANGTNSLNGLVAAGMYSTATLGIAELLEWAQDPWSFWYPQNQLDIILSSLQAPQGSLLPQGAGMTYDLSSRQVPPRPDSNQAYFYNPTQMNTGAAPGQPLPGQDWWERMPFPVREVRAERHVDRNWERNYNPTFMNTGAKPVSPSPGDTREELSLRQVPPRSDETWTYNFNPTQLNSAPPPAGQQVFDTSLRQPPPRPDETWTWNYNPTQMQTGAVPVNQTDWPLPGRPPRPDETWYWSYNVTQLQSGAKPFLQVDWPLPGRYPRPDETWTWNYNPTYMNSGAKPAGASEWELPRARFRMDATWVWPGIQSIPLPLNQYDWPLPGRYPRPDEWFAGFYNPTQMQTGAQPFFQTEWMAVPWPRFRPSSNWDWSTPPGYYPVAAAFPFNLYDWPLPTQQPLRIYGGIYARQVGTGAEPFFQTEWPLPGRYPRPDENWSWPTPPAYYPFLFPQNQYDWPLATPRPRLDATWVQFYNPTQMQTGAQPFPNRDWPLPTLQPIRIYGGIYARQIGTGAEPFFQTEWPLPIPPFRPSFNYERQTPFWLTPIQFPFNQYDWPTPRTYPRPDETWAYFYNPTQMQTGLKPTGFQHYDLTGRPYRPDDNWVSNPLTFTTTITFPPGQQLYDIPWRVDPAAFKRGVAYARRAIQASQPFAQYDWPLPTPPFRPSFNFDPPISNVFTAPQPFPHNQYDWPLPVPLFRPNFNYQYYYVLEQIVQNPFYQTEWPLPLVALQPNRSFDWSPINLMRVTPLPFNQYDWPLPTPKFRIEQTTGFSYNPTQMATGAKPFAQTEWPVPQAPLRASVTVYAWDGANNPNIYTPPAPRTVKIEWLIRARRRGRR